MNLTEETFEEVITSPVPILVEAFVPNAPPQIQEYSDKIKKIVSDYKGVVRLARLNVQDEPQVAEEFKVTHVPTVMAILQGKLFFNKIVGPSTETAVQKYILALLSMSFGTEVESILNEADQLLENNDIEGSAKLFNQLFTSPKYRFAEAFGYAGLIQCALKEKNMEAAKHLAETIRNSFPDILNVPRVKQALSQVDLSDIENNSDFDVNALLQKVEKDPKDIQSLYDLGLYYHRIGKDEDAINYMFKVIKIDREWNEQAAKKTLIKIFDSLGEDSDIVTKGRKRLNNLWFS
uniref:Thioredoxin domain-containing protein n=1 Tax=Arcella intermedia TaxID=1963864 RepID=A0A6B2LCJ8_9EUKA